MARLHLALFVALALLLGSMILVSAESHELQSEMDMDSDLTSTVFLEADADTDADADSDTEGDAESDLNADAETEAEMEHEMEAELEAGDQGELEHFLDSQMDSESDADADAQLATWCWDTTASYPNNLIGTCELVGHCQSVYPGVAVRVVEGICLGSQGKKECCIKQAEAKEFVDAAEEAAAKAEAA
jgi:hypothetical protein